MERNRLSAAASRERARVESEAIASAHAIAVARFERARALVTALEADTMCARHEVEYLQSITRNAAAFSQLATMAKDLVLPSAASRDHSSSLCFHVNPSAPVAASALRTIACPSCHVYNSAHAASPASGSGDSCGSRSGSVSAPQSPVHNFWAPEVCYSKFGSIGESDVARAATESDGEEACAPMECSDQVRAAAVAPDVSMFLA
eukprot:c11790_g1_i2.p1 GENE.c11790_g1_i2~~c11790_g1_i2.p1  ORF type:complete len:205 (-),score=24.38 c11790_g1_i2:324-938(-)